MRTVLFRNVSADIPIPHVLLPGVDTKSGSLFCAECENFIYDAEIDDFHLSTILFVEEKQSHFQGARHLPL